MLVGTVTDVQYNNLDAEEKKSANGVTKIAQRQLTHDRFKETLSPVSLIRTQNLKVAFSSHQLHTVNIKKLSLNAFDDKRFFLDNGIDTFPYGRLNIVHDCSFDEEKIFDKESLSSWLSGVLYEIEN